MQKYLNQFPEVIAIVSEGKNGSMKLSEKGTDNWKNREVFLRENKINIKNVVSARLAHGVNVATANTQDGGKVIEDVDGLVTKSTETFLAVTAADCVPVFFYDTEQKIVALSHAGWKGIVGNIVKNTIEKIVESGGKVENVFVTLGPGINDCHYDISEDRAKKFSACPEFIKRRDGKIFVDLKGIIKNQLIAVGVKAENIENDPDCTYCSKNFFSYRRDKSDPMETMIAVIGMKQSTKFMV